MASFEALESRVPASSAWSRITGGVAAILLLGGAPAVAQDAADPAAEAARADTQAEAAVDQKLQGLQGVLRERAKGNDAGVEVQKRIDTIADETDDLLSQYRTALKQIDAINIYNRQMQELIASQEAELASLRDQLDRVDLVGRSVTPLMLRMIDAVEAFVELDIPFLLDERTERVASLRKVMNRADVTNAEKYRQIMEAYQIENEYGRTIEAYRGTLKQEGKEVIVDFLRFGRIALVYQTLDEGARGVWDNEARDWRPLDDDYRSSIRQGIRIARKQAAPDLIRLPLPAAEKAESAS